MRNQVVKTKKMKLYNAEVGYKSQAAFGMWYNMWCRCWGSLFASTLQTISYVLLCASVWIVFLRMCLGQLQRINHTVLWYTLVKLCHSLVLSDRHFNSFGLQITWSRWIGINTIWACPQSLTILTIRETVHLSLPSNVRDVLGQKGWKSAVHTRGLRKLVTYSLFLTLCQPNTWFKLVSKQDQTFVFLLARTP